jgi:DNA invertase Pin-like site-specific DNA recombinase
MSWLFQDTAPRQSRAVGYVRVSTAQQVLEGLSLAAQTDRIRAYCISRDITLIETVADEGVSAKSLNRPGMRRVLRMLRQGAVDCIVVFKLDRLSRNVKDLAYLCDEYFRDGQPYSLLSVCDAIDTRSATGKCFLNVVMSMSQCERESIGERTALAMRELKRRGVQLGGPPFGWRYSDELDAEGRRQLVPAPIEQLAISRICALNAEGLKLYAICRRLQAEGIPARKAGWNYGTVLRVLLRAGQQPNGRSSRDSDPQEGIAERRRRIVRERQVAIRRAHELRQEGLSLRKIGDRLRREKILPTRCDVWHAASILDLLRHPIPAQDRHADELL